ncbi:MAG: MalY/PatB family protein [Granulosicoccaceae bacterium]
MQYDFDTVLDRKNTDSMKWDKYAGTDILPLWVADMDFAMPPPVHAALMERMQHPLLGYATASESVIEATLDHLQASYNWQVQPEWLVWLPGVVSGLSNACRAYGEQGDHVITSSPIYYHFLGIAEQAGRELIDVPLKEENAHWSYDLEALEKAATHPRAKLLMLCSPHNPVGRVFSREELQAVVAIARRHDLVVVSDEIHDGIVLDQDKEFVPTAMACPDDSTRIVTLMSPSKTYNLAGNNCSYAIIPDPELRQRFMHHAKGAIPPATPLSYVALEASYRHCAEWREQLLEYLRGNRDMMRDTIDRLPGLRTPHLEATYLAWIDVSALRLNDAPAWFEQQARLGLSPGEPFGDADCVRINLACSRATLSEALQRFEDAVRSRLKELS